EPTGSAGGNPAPGAAVWLSENYVINPAASASSRAAATSGGGSWPWRESVGKLSDTVASVMGRPAFATASEISTCSGLETTRKRSPGVTPRHSTVVAAARASSPSATGGLDL